MLEFNSFAVIEKSALKELCEKAILKIKESRKEKNSRYIFQLIEERHTWLKKLFGIKKMTFEEMKAQIDFEIKAHSSDFLFPHFGDYPNITGWQRLEVAEKLLKACECSEIEDRIFVNIEELNYILNE